MQALKNKTVVQEGGYKISPRKNNVFIKLKFKKWGVPP